MEALKPMAKPSVTEEGVVKYELAQLLRSEIKLRRGARSLDIFPETTRFTNPAEFIRASNSHV